MNYIWDQNYDFITIIVDLESNVRARDILCDLSCHKIKLSILGETICEDELEAAIYPDQTVWYISTNNKTKQLFVELAKIEVNEWWKRLLKSDIIDSDNLLGPPRKIDELDGNDKEAFQNAARRIHEMRKAQDLLMGSE